MYVSPVRQAGGSSSVPRSCVKVAEPRQYNLIKVLDGRPLMMMDAAVVENHGIVPGDIPASHLGALFASPPLSITKSWVT